jgi:hypothetical protein
MQRFSFNYDEKSMNFNFKLKYTGNFIKVDNALSHGSSFLPVYTGKPEWDST